MLRRPFQFLGYSLPAGYGVASIASLVHMREDLYPAAGEFQPQRFLQGKYSPFEFVPFGGGTHRCLGATFAFYEMKVVLAALLRHYRFTSMRPRRFGPAGNKAFRSDLTGRLNSFSKAGAYRRAVMTPPPQSQGHPRADVTNANLAALPGLVPNGVNVAIRAKSRTTADRKAARPLSIAERPARQ